MAFLLKIQFLQLVYRNRVLVSINDLGGAEAVDMTSRINAIQTNVAAWFNNNGNYDSAMEVIESGNNADIQSLMQCYSAGSTL